MHTHFDWENHIYLVKVLLCKACSLACCISTITFFRILYTCLVTLSLFSFLCTPVLFLPLTVSPPLLLSIPLPPSLPPPLPPPSLPLSFPPSLLHRSLRVWVKRDNGQYWPTICQIYQGELRDTTCMHESDDLKANYGVCGVYSQLAISVNL